MKKKVFLEENHINNNIIHKKNLRKERKRQQSLLVQHTKSMVKLFYSDSLDYSSNGEYSFVKFTMYDRKESTEMLKILFYKLGLS